jgi:glucuronosyltransferase
MLPMEKMAEDLAQSFIQTFARLPQKVIWQWKGKVRSDLPANVLAIPWLPQQDLLGIHYTILFYFSIHYIILLQDTRTASFL